MRVAMEGLTAKVVRQNPGLKKITLPNGAMITTVE